jgi:hypothetical protein
VATSCYTMHPASPFRIPVGQPLQFGQLQESLFRTLLAEIPDVQVVYDASADAIYKLDAVVWWRDKPLLPAVGVQFTINPDQEKRLCALRAVHRSGVVSRFLYVQLSRCQVDQEAVELVSVLIRRVAELPGMQVMLSAVVKRNHLGLVICSTDLKTLRYNYQELDNQIQEASQ